MKRALAIYAIYGLALVAVVGAGCFAVAALHVYLDQRYGPIQANLALAGLLIVVALIFAGVAMAMGRRKRERTLSTTALMVAPADGARMARADAAFSSFAEMPTARLPFPSILVASRDDPYMSFAASRSFAAGWGAALVDAGR